MTVIYTGIKIKQKRLKSNYKSLPFVELVIQSNESVYIMEDKRIKKTKKYLKETLIKMLEDIPFEQITVTQLCDQSDISRITFYSHYTDKYDLVEDIFADMVSIGTEDYRKRQLSNNADNDITIGFTNVMDSILALYYNNFDFFKHTSPDENPYLAFTFYNHVLNTVEHHTNKEKNRHRLNYTSRQITGFLCYGLLGFINESSAEALDTQRIRNDAHNLLDNLLHSRILF